MAKKFELLSKSYEMIKVTPGAAKADGVIETHNDINGFYPVEFTAAQFAAGEKATLVIRADRVKAEKIAAEAWLPGEWVYWDGVAVKTSNVAGALKKIGYVGEAAIATTTHGIIIFDGSLYI